MSSKAIEVRQRFRPFTHVPGQRIPIPGTYDTVQVFPGRLVFNGEREVLLPMTGAAKDFLATLDLEKGRVSVECHLESGFFRTHIDRDWMVHIDKAPWGSEKTPSRCKPIVRHERLSFGNHKKQDWNRIVARQDLAEFLPFWYRLGKMTPSATSRVVFSPDTFWDLFRTRFSDLLVPHLEDFQYWGVPLETTLGCHPHSLLYEGAQAIEKMLLDPKGQELFVLPHLHYKLHCGRLINVPMELGSWKGVVSLEWTKKKVRRLHLRCQEDGELYLRVRHGVSSCRFNQERRADVSDPLVMKKGEQIMVDRFC